MALRVPYSLLLSTPSALRFSSSSCLRVVRPRNFSTTPVTQLTFVEKVKRVYEQVKPEPGPRRSTAEKIAIGSIFFSLVGIICIIDDEDLDIGPIIKRYTRGIGRPQRELARIKYAMEYYKTHREPTYEEDEVPRISYETTFWYIALVAAAHDDWQDEEKRAKVAQAFENLFKGTTSYQLSRRHVRYSAWRMEKILEEMDGNMEYSERQLINAVLKENAKLCDQLQFCFARATLMKRLYEQARARAQARLQAQEASSTPESSTPQSSIAKSATL